MIRVALFGRFRIASSNGVDRTIEGHLLEMLGRGYEVTLFTKENPRPKEKAFLEDRGVKVRVLSRSLPNALIQCWRERGKFTFLALHSVFTPLNWVASITMGCPWILTPNGGYSPAQIRYRGYLRKTVAFWVFEKRMLEKSLFVHVLSTNEVEQLGLVAPRARTVIAPNGFDSAGLKERLSLPEKPELRLLFIGRVALMHKGLDLLFAGLREVPAGLDWHLDIVGPPEAGALARLEEIMKGSPNRERIEFHGPLYGEEKERLISEADLFVHTSRYEGMPFAVIEAMSAGLAVLITPGTNMAELVEKHNAGWVIDGEVRADELEVVLSANYEEVVKRGRQAQELVREELNWAKIGGIVFGEVEQRLLADKEIQP